jgi:hypothetical protein
MFKILLKYMYIQYKEHKATLDAHKQASGRTNGTQTAAIKKIQQNFPTSSKLITTRTCLNEYNLTLLTMQ